MQHGDGDAEKMEEGDGLEDLLTDKLLCPGTVRLDTAATTTHDKDSGRPAHSLRHPAGKRAFIIGIRLHAQCRAPTLCPSLSQPHDCRRERPRHAGGYVGPDDGEHHLRASGGFAVLEISTTHRFV